MDNVVHLIQEYIVKKFILWFIVLYLLVRVALAGVDYIISTAKADGDQHLEKIEQIEGGE